MKIRSLDDARQHWRHLAAGFVGAINRGIMDYGECVALLQAAAMRTPLQLSVDDRITLANFAEIAMADALMRPELAAQHDIRNAVTPLLQAKKLRVEIYLAAHRASDCRLPAAQVEKIADAEIAAFMARLREAGKLRHAG